jgi:hypothetical protein
MDTSAGIELIDHYRQAEQDPGGPIPAANSMILETVMEVKSFPGHKE